MPNFHVYSLVCADTVPRHNNTRGGEFQYNSPIWIQEFGVWVLWLAAVAEWCLLGFTFAPWSHLTGSLHFFSVLWSIFKGLVICGLLCGIDCLFMFLWAHQGLWDNQISFPLGYIVMWELVWSLLPLFACCLVQIRNEQLSLWLTDVQCCCIWMPMDTFSACCCFILIEIQPCRLFVSSNWEDFWGQVSGKNVSVKQTSTSVCLIPSSFCFFFTAILDLAWPWYLFYSVLDSHTLCLMFCIHPVSFISWLYLSTMLCGSHRNSGWPWMKASGTAL